MMYSEFIEISGISEKYITMREYTDMVEPVYTHCELSKADFCKLLNEIIEKMVYPVVEQKMHSLSMEEKLIMIEDLKGADQIKERVQKVDAEARKLAYQYMKLYLLM